MRNVVLARLLPRIFWWLWLWLFPGAGGDPSALFWLGEGIRFILRDDHTTPLSCPKSPEGVGEVGSGKLLEDGLGLVSESLGSFSEVR